MWGVSGFFLGYAKSSKLHEDLIHVNRKLYTIRYLLIFLKQMVSKIKRPSLWKGLDSLLKYMCIVAQCGLLSIVEYGTTVSVVDCVQFSVYVNQIFM
jgi:hypothetical protein